MTVEIRHEYTVQLYAAILVFTSLAVISTWLEGECKVTMLMGHSCIYVHVRRYIYICCNRYTYIRISIAPNKIPKKRLPISLPVCARMRSWFFLACFLSFIQGNSGNLTAGPVVSLTASGTSEPKSSTQFNLSPPLYIARQYPARPILEFSMIDESAKPSLIWGTPVINSAMLGWLLMKPVSRSPAILHMCNLGARSLPWKIL